MSEKEEIIEIKKSDYIDILDALNFCLEKIQQLHPEEFPLYGIAGTLGHETIIKRLLEEKEE